MKDAYGLCNAENSVHVMLYEDQGEIELLPKAPDEVSSQLSLFRRHARGGFVQEKQFRFKSQSDTDVQELLVAVSKLKRETIRLSVKSKALQDTVGLIRGLLES